MPEEIDTMLASTIIDESLLSYRGPDTKQVTSARLHRSTRRGLDAAVALWKARARQVGDDDEAIDLTYVMDAILAAGLQSELKQYLGESGQLPTSETAWDEILSRITKQTR